MSYLLDTHVVVWLVGKATPPRKPILERLESIDSRVLVSSVSAYELGTKVRLGKLDEASDLAQTWSASIRRLGAIELDLRHEHATMAAGLDWDHRDPFDRLLVAQAQVEGLTIVTADRTVLGAPGVEVLAW